MQKTLTVYRVFLSSPSDLAEERLLVKDVIDELNRTWGRAKGLFIELVTWESHAAPGISRNGPQGVITQDVGEDWDLYLGLLWKRFGTRTQDYGSGTLEEFESAKRRFHSDERSTQVMFYFKNEPPSSLDDIDPDQYALVRTFKAGLGDEGVLYWTFRSAGDFQQSLRMHIPTRLEQLIELRAIGRLIGERDLVETPPTPLAPLEEPPNEEDDWGTLDYEILISESLAASNQALTNMTEATNLIGDQFNQGTDEAGRIFQMSPSLRTRQVLALSMRLSKHLKDYADRLALDGKIFLENYERGLRLTTTAVHRFDDIRSKEDTQALIKSLAGVQTAMDTGANGLLSFQSTLKGMPRLEKNLNIAVKLAVASQEEMLGRISTAKKLSIDLLNLLQTPVPASL